MHLRLVGVNEAKPLKNNSTAAEVDRRTQLCFFIALVKTKVKTVKLI